MWYVCELARVVTVTIVLSWYIGELKIDTASSLIAWCDGSYVLIGHLHSLLEVFH